MRAGIVAIFFFAALLALGHYVAAPFFCRGELAIPTLDPRALCGADMHFNRSGSVLLYFASIAGALFFGIVAGLLPGGSRKAPEEKKPEPNAAVTFEQIVAEEEKKLAATPPVAQTSAQASQPAAAAAAVSAEAPSTEVAPVTSTPQAPPVAPPPAHAETPPGPPHAVAAAAQAAITGATFAPPTQKAAAPSPETTAKAEAITVGLAAAKSASHSGPFDGTNPELIERFRELKKNENVNSIAQAQRLLDESTLSALGKGIDPKQHLSDVAHLVLMEDPDLKSGVVRGVVVHIAARLKELGVVQKIPNPAKPAA
jgi:hypothetical protein